MTDDLCLPPGLTAPREWLERWSRPETGKEHAMGLITLMFCAKSLSREEFTLQMNRRLAAVPRHLIRECQETLRENAETVLAAEAGEMFARFIRRLADQLEKRVAQ